MLVEVSWKKGVGVHVVRGHDKVLESFFVGDLWFVVFDNGKWAVEGKVGGKVLCSGFEWLN